MKCLKIYHDDKYEEDLINNIKNVMNQRYLSGISTKYEIKKAKDDEY